MLIYIILFLAVFIIFQIWRTLHIINRGGFEEDYKRRYNGKLKFIGQYLDFMYGVSPKKKEFDTKGKTDSKFDALKKENFK